MNPSSQNLLLHRTFQYIGIILVLAALGGGYWYWKNARAAQTVTDNRPSFEAPLTTSLDLAAGVGGPTFSRADGADRRATVTDFEGRIIPVKQNEARFEGARRVENLASSSENFGTWIGSGGATVTTNTTTAPDGNLSADAINSTGINSRVYFIKSENAGYFANRSFRHTVWVKSLTGGDTPAALYLRNQVESVFTGQSGGLTTFTATTTWQRVTTLTSIGNDTASTGMSVWIRAGDNISAYGNIAVWGAQLEDVTGQTNQNPSEYVSCGVKPSAPYHGANVDCVKYFDTQNGNTVASNVVTEATGAKIPSSTLKGYLAEGSRINLLARSEEVDNGIWTGSNVTISANAVSAPSGQMNADTMTETTAASTQFQRANSVTISSGSTYTISAFVKRGSGTTRHMRLELSGSTHGFRANFNTDTGAVASTAVIGSGTVATAGSVAYPNGWYRFYVTGTASTETSVTFFYRMTASLDGSITYTGDGSSSFYVWGAQLEQAPFASSYIPTTTASVTRAGDSLSYSINGNYSEAEGSSFAEVTHESWSNSSYARIISSTNGSGTPLSVDGAGTKFGSFDGTTNNTLNRVGTGTQRAATKWSPSGKTTFTNATASTQNSYDGSFGLSNIAIGRTINTSCPDSYCELWHGSIKNVRIWKKALSDTELTNMTSATDAIANSATRETTVKAPDNTGLVGYWSFEDGSGTKAEDFSPSGANTGTLTNGPTWVDGKIGKAVSFDGVDDYVTISQPGTQMSPNVFTISGYMKPDSHTSRFLTPYSNGVDQWIGYDGTNQRIEVMVTESADTNQRARYSTDISVPIGTWTHWAVLIHDKNIKIYINGALNAEFNETINIANWSGDWFIGQRGNATYWYKGALDEVRIYDRALSATEIAGLYNQSAASHTTVNVNQNDKITSGLVGFWSFNGKDISGTTAYDRSGNSNDGTLTNGPTVYPGKVGQALSFDGTNDFVDIPDNATLDISGDMSMSLWLKPTADYVGYAVHPIAKWTGTGDANYVLYYFGTTSGTNRSLQFYANRGGAWGAVSVGYTAALNEWVHVAVSYTTSGGGQLYVNGVASGSLTGGGSLATNTATVRVGGTAGGFRGLIDEVRIYNRALSATEIASLYSMGR